MLQDDADCAVAERPPDSRKRSRIQEVLAEAGVEDPKAFAAAGRRAFDTRGPLKTIQQLREARDRDK